MFVGEVDLGNGTGVQLVITPLKGSFLGGLWDTKTDLLLICHMQSGRCCTFRPDDHYDRYREKLGLGTADAKLLAEWLKNNL